jgi:probable phosphoglycerate mutase
MTNGSFLSFDYIMKQIPDYQQDLYLLGTVQAFKKWEIPARIIGYEILYRAIMSKFDITLEHSGVHLAHLQLIKTLKEIGYDTNVYFITCPLSLALSRTEMREKQTQRHTPAEMVKQRFVLADIYLEKYKTIADHTYLYDTSSNQFVLKGTFNL